MRALRTKPVYKVYYYYNNLTLRKHINILKLKKKKWVNLKLQINQQPKYLCNFRKLNIKRFYYYKFVNKQVLKNYFVNYTETNFRSVLQQKHNFLTYEQRLDFNLYKAKFVSSLYAARFYITNGYIFVNDHCIRNVNYFLKQNDCVTIDNRLKQKISKVMLQTLHQSNLQLYYIPNLEIDYLTYSFIFLDNTKFYISNSNNQIKKINFIEKKKVLKLKQSFQNNYFQYANYFFNYYLFCNDLNTKKKISSLQQINIILKFLGFYFTDYYCRNLLLKQSFRLKYEYFQNLIIFSKSCSLQNLQTLFQTNNQNIFHQTIDTPKNLLFLTFFKYHWNLLFSFYIQLLKYQFISFRVLNFDNLRYEYQILINNRNLKIIFSKIALFQYFNHYIKTTPYNGSNSVPKYKILNYTTIARKYKPKIKYLTVVTYKNLLLYISSTQFKYRIYRKCHSFQQNDNRRQKLIFHFKKALTYQYFNKIRLGNYFKQRTKHEFYNYLNTQKIITPIQNPTNLIKRKILITNLYYPRLSETYQLVYNPAIIAIENLITNLVKIKIEIQQLQNSMHNFNLIEIQNKVQQKIDFFTKTKSFLNLNYNQYYRLLYLLNYWVHHKRTLHKSNLYSLSVRTYQVLYKLHLRQNYTQKSILHTKVYARSQFNLQRMKVNYLKIPYNKSRCFLAATIRKYFIFSSFGISKWLLNSIILNLRLHKSKISTIKKQSLKNNTAIFNFYLISGNLKFCDQIFFIDLFINLTIRKLNLIYNTFQFQNLQNKNLNEITIVSVKHQKQNFVMKTRYNSNKKMQTLIFNCRKISHYQTQMNNRQYFKHIKQYLNKKQIQRIEVKQIKKKNNRLWIIQQLYVSYSVYIRKYKILKYMFNQFVWKEYQVFNNQLFNQEKLKFIDIQYSKLLYANLLFNKFFNFSTFDNFFVTNYHYSFRIQILINYFILITRLYY